MMQRCCAIWTAHTYATFATFGKKSPVEQKYDTLEMGTVNLQEIAFEKEVCLLFLMLIFVVEKRYGYTFLKGILGTRTGA